MEPWISGGNKFWRFKYKIGTLTEMMGLAIGVSLESRFTFEKDDFGLNTTEMMTAKPWKGSFNSRFRI
jgi:hypothetical protein